ncbi:MAG TPA: EcsC family protein [Chitinophagaceae bacterium]|nr:EcsC family protein [Chitinophagaceae bacterium]
MQYEIKVGNELRKWQKKMQRKPSLINRMSKRVQKKINNLIPEKVHTAMTTTIKQMVKVVLFGSKITTDPPRTQGSLEVREAVVEEKIRFYRKAAAIEGGVTGAGGILMGLADFPLLLGIKLKMLFDIASVYGFDVRDYKERVYLLYIFQLAFSSQEQRRKVYVQLEDWNKLQQALPGDINQFDWRTFQQEYRDYIDIAKMAQLVPLIGAPVGVVVNYQLIKKLGNTAMNAYRMRWLKE